MKTYRVLLLFFLLGTRALSAQFAPPAGQPGTTAIYKDSSVFVNWATTCSVTLGYQDISNTAFGLAAAGDSSMAIGMAGANGVVSLGDGGVATLTFAQPLQNGPGWDFAVFENSFDDAFLELAFVEVSSDGINFFRFPATSNTQDTLQTSAFGYTDATRINNLAGKYRALYGTPFDLQELTGTQDLDLNAITHVRIVDVVGSILPAYARYDSAGHTINDPWSTPFASSGFDLDAVGVIHQGVVGVAEWQPLMGAVVIFPQPAADQVSVTYSLTAAAKVSVQVFDAMGRQVLLVQQGEQQAGTHTLPLDGLQGSNQVYFLRLQANAQTVSAPFLLPSR